MRKPIDGHVPEETLAELKRLSDLSRQASGAVPLGDPRRVAGDEFCALAVQVIDEFSISSGQLSLMLGLSYDNIRLKLSRRGHLNPLPSQKNYKGKVAIPYAGGSEKKEFCAKGHPYAGDNLIIITSTGARRCRECENASSRARYAAKKAADRG